MKHETLINYFKPGKVFKMKVSFLPINECFIILEFLSPSDPTSFYTLTVMDVNTITEFLFYPKSPLCDFPQRYTKEL